MESATSIDEGGVEEAPPGLSPATLQRTWGLGAVAWVLCVLLALSGIALMFYYRPVPALASLSLLDLEATSRLAFLRGVHFWGSRVLVVVVWLHLFRVVVREAYRPPRHWAWLGGVGLLLLTLAFARTGAILPAASHLDGGALLVVYALHCAVLPGVFFVGVGWHLWRTRKDGGGAS